VRRSVGASEGTVFSLGSTISPTDPGSGGNGVEPNLTDETLVTDMPEIAEVADVSAVSVCQAASGELTVDVRGGMMA
jgi:hypothetical protein